MQPARLDLRIIQGATFRKPLLLQQPVFSYRPIAEIQRTAPLRLTVPAHSLPGDWPVWVEGVQGWSALNRDKVKERFRMAAVIDADTLEFNELNGSAQVSSGGFLVYRLPLDMTGATARLHIRDAGGQLLLALTTENSGLVVSGSGQLMLVISAEQTAAITWPSGLYDLELVMSDGSVGRWAEGEVSVSREQTHD